jgi:hypothetical protein
MTPEQKGSLPLQVEKLFYEMQDRIFSDIVRRIKKTEEITSTADYQINKLLILGNSTELIEQEIKRLTEKTDPEMWELYDKVSNWEYVRHEDAYLQINGNFTPLEENEQVRQWSQAVISQTNNEIQNITQSLGMTVDMGGGKKAFTPLSQYYQSYLDRACMDIVTGAFDYNTVLRRVVKELSVSGLRTIDYASGYSSRAPVAARRAIMTGVSQLSAQINEMVARNLGTDTYEVTWHAGHRPSHWWGGNIYTKQELQDVCHLGDVDGLCGANCRHSYYAFVPGYSVRTYSPDRLRELEAQEQEVRRWNGKQYNAYEATQKQRQMETTMRAQREKITLLKKGGADQTDIEAARARYINSLRQYQSFSKRMELPEQMERVYMDGLGRVLPGKSFSKNVVNSGDSAIIKKSSMYRKKKAQAIEPMPKRQLQKIVKAFRRNGGVMQMDDITDAYLSNKHAEAITYNEKTILLRQNPGRAAVFEELIHATQFRKGENDGTYESRLMCEISAQEKLLKYQKAYKLTAEEVKQTESALKAYRKELDEWKKRR